MNSPIIKLTQKASRNSSLIAHLVAIYVETEQKSWEQVGIDLNITPEQLAQLSLCNRPRDGRFSDDVTQIADYVKMDKYTLIKFIRRTQALDAMQSSQQDQWLMAARDRETDIDESIGDE